MYIYILPLSLGSRIHHQLPIAHSPMKTQNDDKIMVQQQPTLQHLVLGLLLFVAGAALAASLFASSSFSLINPIKLSTPSTFIPVPSPTPTPSSDPPSQPTPLSDFVHNMTDDELLSMATLIGGTTQKADVGKVALLFLVKGPLHLEELWERFFRGNRGLYSIYVHAPPSYNATFFTPVGSVFRGRRIPSKEVQWGGFNMVEAERRLLASALLDTSNQRFVLLSESCMPLFNFSTIYSYLINSNKTFVEAYDLPGPVGRDRYNPKMKPVVKLSQWRKGSQWFQIDRNLANQVVSDNKYFGVFNKHCKGSCYGDEHYLPTFVSINYWRENSNRTLTWVDWSRGGPHPRTFQRPLVTVPFLEGLRNTRTCEYNGEGGNVCFLFARKFPPNSLVRLLLFAPKVLHIK